MTIQQFDAVGFQAGDRALYDGINYDIITVDFKEKLIGLNIYVSGAEPDHITWVRCENIVHLSAINV